MKLPSGGVYFPYMNNVATVEEKPKKKPPAGNPDPNNYQLVKAEERPGFLIVLIKYPDCTNYEGNKILVFRNLTLLELVNQKLIDPHFFPNDNKFQSPIARFVPTDEGWTMALALIDMLSKPPAPTARGACGGMKRV